MKVNSIRGISNTNIFSGRRNCGCISRSEKSNVNAEDILLLAAKGICFIGAASALNVILKENNINIVKTAEAGIKNLASYLPKFKSAVCS